MTWTSSRSCSHSTVSICLVQGRSAIPPLPNLSIAVRSEHLSELSIVAIFFSFYCFLLGLRWPCSEKNLTYSGIPRRKPTDFAYLLVTDRRRCGVASFSGRSVPFFGILRQMFECSFSMFLSCVVFVVVAKGECLGIATLALKRNILTSPRDVIGHSSCHLSDVQLYT